jgi:hypothetical protein
MARNVEESLFKWNYTEDFAMSTEVDVWPIPDLDFETELVGEVDGAKIRLLGEGTINEGVGWTEGTFDIIDLPDDIDPRSLGAFMFTGYPNSCQMDAPQNVNPFWGGDYRYARCYSFSESGSVVNLDVRCNVDRKRRRLTSVFAISGDMPRLGPIVGVSPIYEVWRPGAESIDGSFVVSWLGEETGEVKESARADSKYSPVDLSALMGHTKRRYISLNSHVDPRGQLVVRQSSHLTSL